MKKILFYMIFVTASLNCFSQKIEFSENECKIKIDSIYQHCKYRKAKREVLKLCLANPNNAKSLENLYYLKRYTGKEELKNTLNKLSDGSKSNIYAKSLDIFIHTDQIKEGDRYYDFNAKTSGNENFTLSEVLKEKDVLLIFDGLSCMGEKSRQKLRELYNKLDLSKVEVVSFLNAKNEEDLKETIKKYNVTWLTISDYQGVMSKTWLAYMIVGTPTTVFINTQGEVLVSRPGLVDKAIKLLKNHVKI